MAATTPQEFKVIGTRPVRPDGIEKVNGRAKYGADYNFPGMLHGKVLRSPYAHAIIKSINYEKALRLPGVKAVITSQDLPEAPNRQMAAGEAAANPRDISCNIMARGKVLYDGHAVAAVAATSPHIAEEALELIEVEYEPLPPVMTALEAIAPNAPIISDELRDPESGDQPTNIAGRVQFKRGDLEAGFKAADFIVEREFIAATVHQGYIEPHNAVGIYNSDGNGTIYTSTQAPFDVRRMSSLMLGMPLGKIRVVPAEIGGGFGGKTTIYLEPLALLLSQKTGVPVKLVMSRNEVLRATGPTAGGALKVKMGATRDGRITAAQVWMAYEAGAFPGSPVGPGAMCTIAPYAIPNFQIDALDVLVNRPKVAAYRAPGATNAEFVTETVIDELAEKCKLDPIEFRLRNAVKQGSATVAGPPFGPIGFIEVCEAIKNSEHYRTPLTGKNRGRGVGFGFWFNVGLQSSATVNVNPDGTASVVTGSVDIGGTRASFAMIAAEVLGLAAEDVHAVVADTDSIGYTDLTAGSRTTFATGLAIYDAAHDAVRQIKERAARLWELKVEDIDYREGKAFSKNNGVAPVSLKDLAARTGNPIVGRASVNARGAGPSFSGCLVDIEVDPETGKCQVLRCTIAQDAGRAIHPSYVEGQMQGGAAQGLGWALNEEYYYDNQGRMRNTGFLDYRMPTCLDLPPIETLIVEVPNPNHPLGIRGVGEASIVPPVSAAANAVYHAVGVRMTELPMSPPRLLKAIMDQRETKRSR
jgi:xanthine dehydrogenase molybdenum-binding subunit